MPAPTITPGNVQWGFAYGWLAPANTAVAADTVAYGADWVSPWVYIGATADGVHRNFQRNTQDITVEEQSTPVGVAVQSSAYEVTWTFAEETLENLKYAVGGGTLSTVVGPPAKKVLTFSDTLTQLALGFDALGIGGKTYRVYVPVVLGAATVLTDYRRGSGPRVFPAQFRAICAMSAITETLFT